jgi:DNA-binding PadR family transcriptional regulator
MSGSEAQPAAPPSPVTLAILLALTGGDQHGYGILKAVEAQPDAPRLGTGTLYAALQRLTADGLIAESERAPVAGEDQRRRYYRITPLGREVAGVELARLARIVAQPAARVLLREVRLPAVRSLAEGT